MGFVFKKTVFNYKMFILSTKILIKVPNSVQIKYLNTNCLINLIILKENFF